jgi:hypothetical protein
VVARASKQGRVGSTSPPSPINLQVASQGKSNAQTAEDKSSLCYRKVPLPPPRLSCLLTFAG